MQPQQPGHVQPQVIYTTLPMSTSRYTRYKTGTNRALGTVQVTLGILCFLFQIVAICVKAYMNEIGTGIWSAVLFILAGSFAIQAAKSKSKCSVITTMVLSVISSVAAGIVVILQCMAMALEPQNNFDFEYPHQTHPARYAMNALIMMCAFDEMLIAIAQAALCCQVACCGAGQQTNQALVMNAAPPQVQYTGHQMLVYTQGQMLPMVASPQGVVGPTMMSSPAYQPAQATAVATSGVQAQAQTQTQTQPQAVLQKKVTPGNVDASPPPSYTSMDSPVIPVATDAAETRQGNPSSAQWEQFA